MIKLLIADDEPLVCVGLQSMLRWEDYNIEIAGTARNGQQAADMIEDLRPDIVITDIKMPIKTGLELAAECYRKHGRIPLFIILTSYEEFDFVRQALEFQAVDYLLKLELSPEALDMSIRRAIKILEELRGTGQASNPAGAFCNEVSRANQIQGLREKFFLKLFNGLFEDRIVFTAQMEELNLKFGGDSATARLKQVQLMVLNTEIEAPQFVHANEEKLRVLYASTIQMVWEKLEKLFPCYLAVMDSRHFSIVFYFSRTELAAQQVSLEGELRKNIDMVNRYFNVHIRMAMGFPVDDPFNLDESYLAAQQAFRETTRERPLAFFGKHASLIRCFEPGARINYKQQVVANVQEYIRHNLDKRLSLHDLAAIFYLSPNYLSQLFAKYAGEGFVEYVTSERIKTAKEMLKKGTWPIYKIAERLGFQSAFYFSKVFKKVEGISPREFLRKLENGETN